MQRHDRMTVAVILIGLLCLFLMVVGSVRGAEVTLAWDMPTNNVDGTPLVCGPGWSDIGGCRVYWGTASRIYSANTNLPGCVTNCTIPNLQQGTTYYFAGTCYNNVGNESDFSAELVWLCPDTTPPSITYPAMLYEHPDQADGTVPCPDVVAACTATDNLPGPVTIEQMPVAGTRIGPGVQDVLVSARDTAGNTAVAHVGVTVWPVPQPMPVNMLRIVPGPGR